MFLFIHLLLGGLIGLQFSSWLFVISLAFLSHFVLDIMPHWGIGFDRDHFKTTSEVIYTKKTAAIFLFDIVLALAVLVVLYLNFKNLIVISGAISGVFPDILSIGYFTGLRHKKHYKKFIHFHNRIQKEAGFLLGTFIQLVIAIFLLSVIF